MNCFIEALVSEGKSAKLPEEDDYFGRLVGSWDIEYVHREMGCSVKGEWHFAWILEGMAIQDVIILPARGARTLVPHPLSEYGTSLRIYHPDTRAWDVVYGYTGKIFRLEAKRQDGKIVLNHLGNARRQWVFVEIGENKFHWQDIIMTDSGEWRVNADIYAESI